jgi:hypothetical protein
METKTELSCPFTFDNDGIIDRSIKEFAGAFSGIKGARTWAFAPDDQQNWLEGGALVAAINADRDGQATGARLAEILRAMCAIENFGSNVLMPEPPPEPQLPEPLIDPVTKLPVPNPYAEPDEKKRLRLIADVKTHNPALAEHFEAMHTRPAAHLKKMAEQKAAAERERAIKYNGDMDAGNPYKNGDLKSQAILENVDPVLARVCKRESKAATLGLGNRTRLALLTRSNPQTAATIAKAIDTLKQWKSAIAEQEAQARARARAQAIEYQNALGGVQPRPLSSHHSLSPIT